MSGMSRAERHVQVSKLKEAGLTFAEITDYLGVARSVVTDAYYDPTGEISRRRKRKRHGYCLDCGTETYNSGSEPPERCAQCYTDWTRTLEGKRKFASHPTYVKWTDEAIVAAIKSAAVDGFVTLKMYNEAYAAATDGSMPSSVRICQLGWHSYCARAGVHTVAQKQRIDRVPEAGCLAALADCRAEIGRWPSYTDYQTWARAGGAQSGQTVRNRFGTWMAAIEAAIAQSELEEVAA